MKRSLVAALFVVSGVTFASNNPYNNEAGEQDLHSPQVASSDFYRNNAGDQDAHPSIG